MPRMLAMSLVQRDLGPRSPWGRFRLAVERFDSLLLDVLARRRATAGDDSMLAVLLDQRDEDGNPPSDRHLRDQLVALLAAGHDTSAASLSWAFERLARHPQVQARLREGEPAYLDAVVKEVLRVRPALTIAPRRLLEPVGSPAGRCPPACTWPPACGSRCGARTSGPRRPPSGPSAGWTAARRRPGVLDPVRRRRAPLRRSAIRRDGDARGAARGGAT